MSNGQNSADERSGMNLYSVDFQVKAQSSTSCSFCWFVLALYPTLLGMTTRDGDTYRAHLEKSHGLRDEIQE